VASRDRAAISRVCLVAAVVIALDQLTKALIRGSIALGATRSLVPGVVTLVHTTNSGVAFSLLSGSTVTVTLLAVVVLVILIAYFERHRTTPLLWLPTGMIAGGALGNLIDRLRVGAVTDFIKFPDWPAFNVADSAITLGVIALVLVIGRGGTASSS
jgi:signal peptidase II